MAKGARAKQDGIDSVWERLKAWAGSLWDDDDPSLEPVDTEPPRRARSRRAPTTVRRTPQVERRDCGVAALSMLANISYPRARNLLFPNTKVIAGTTHTQIRGALERLGIEHDAKNHRFRSWDEIPSHALVKIKWRRLPPQAQGHYVVFQKTARGHRVLDPASFAETLTAADTSTMRGVTWFAVDLVLAKDRAAIARRPRRVLAKR